ncbi:MAG TPA: dihydrolipoyl dehydrogenase, partial [bacterium]|nr:dihydrolipoyl dehydrogenase [bacterium]
SALGKAFASGNIQGFTKIIVDPETEKILGVHIIGENATEIIHTASLAISNGLTVKEMLQSYYCHPTFSEIIMEALLVCEGKPLHIPKTKK